MIEVKIKTKLKSSFSKLEEIDSNNLIAYITSPPENNKANLEIIKLLSKKFKIAKSLIILKSGQKSKNKIFEIDL